METNSKKPISKYVKKTFQRYLECGALSKGFACAHCDCCNTSIFYPDLPLELRLILEPKNGDQNAPQM
jgi:hypothetical protein